jgi:nitrous oxidase accessory protein NosD
MNRQLVSSLLPVLLLGGIALAQPVHHVQCGGGSTIETTLKVAKPGDVIRIQGTCRESFVVTTDHLIIEGQGGAIVQGEGGGPRLDAPQIEVLGAQGVVIRNLIVQDAPGGAIQVAYGSAALLENLTLRRSTVGLVVYLASSARLRDVSANDNFAGVLVAGNSAVQLMGEIRANNNQFNGFDVNANSSVEIFEARIQANGNGNRGMTLDESELILGGGLSPGSSFTADGNARSGILVSGNSAVSLFGDPGANTITVSNNREHGIWLNGGKIVSPTGTHIVATGNGIGICVELGGAAHIIGGLNVRNNGIGMDADGAGVIRLVSPPTGPFPPSLIAGNTTVDLDLTFGSRMRVAGPVTITKITCDKTVLTHGVTCP